MPPQANSTSSDLTFWRSWCSTLWKGAEKAWMNRTGQDLFNRDQVIIPAIVSVLASENRFGSLVDIGCGDGYSTSTLVRTLDAINKRPKEILLLDQSERQLTKALRRPALQGAQIATTDFETSEWSLAINLSTSPTVFISIFVIQELPSLEPLLDGLANVLRKDDLALCVTLAPAFSQWLAERGEIKAARSKIDSALDWSWAGGFPVPVGRETVYLPHFQRDLQTIIAAHAAHGLTVNRVKELSIPDSAPAREIFDHTAYGEEIIGRPSSVLLSVTKSQQGAEK